MGAALHVGPLPWEPALREVLLRWQNGIFLALDTVAAFPWWMAVAVAAAAWIAWRRSVVDGALVLVTYGTAEAAELVLKLLVGRPRPAPDLADLVATASFPSGHVVRATAVVGVLYVLLVVRAGARRAAVVTLAIAAVVALAALGLARVASGEHWPTDVLGGYLLGAAVVSAAAAVAAPRHRG